MASSLDDIVFVAFSATTMSDAALDATHLTVVSTSSDSNYFVFIVIVVIVFFFVSRFRITAMRTLVATVSTSQLASKGFYLRTVIIDDYFVFSSDFVLSTSMPRDSTPVPNTSSIFTAIQTFVNAIVSVTTTTTTNSIDVTISVCVAVTIAITLSVSVSCFVLLVQLYSLLCQSHFGSRVFV
jgi:hypothetical protein